MPDRIRPELHQAMIEQAMAYYGGDLSPAEAAEFEAHLATCPGCQAVLRLAKENLPQAMALLAFTPKHTIDQQVARFEALAAETRRTAEAEAGLNLRALTLWLTSRRGNRRAMRRLTPTRRRNKAGCTGLEPREMHFSKPAKAWTFS
jgi:anti-sigma factor RsiW